MVSGDVIMVMMKKIYCTSNLNLYYLFVISFLSLSSSLPDLPQLPPSVLATQMKFLVNNPSNSGTYHLLLSLHFPFSPPLLSSSPPLLSLSLLLIASDVTFSVAGEKIYAHKAILSARCEKFRYFCHFILFPIFNF
jgi:hypothetical protein